MCHFLLEVCFSFRYWRMALKGQLGVEDWQDIIHGNVTVKVTNQFDAEWVDFKVICRVPLN